MQQLTHKRGDTFAFYVNLKDEESNPLIVDVENIRSQIRTTTDKLIEELTIKETEIEGQYLFKSVGTENYPIGTLELDIEINIDGNISSSETIQLKIEKDITK